jgi:hypothetical protein
VELAHAGDDRLAGLLVGVDLEGRVLLGQALDRGAQLLLVALGLRLDGDEMTGSGKLIDSRMIGASASQSVSPVGRLLQADDGADVPAVARSISSRLFACIR